jgi:copper chaperone CopZ
MIMTHTYQIDGMHCGSCVAKVKNELLKLGDITTAEIQLKAPQATVTMLKHISTASLQQAVAKAGAFTLKETDEHHSTTNDIVIQKSWLATYKPLLLVFAFITAIAFLTAKQHGEFRWMHWMHSFMGGFFIAFSFFKLLDLKGFADSYSSYDLLAKKMYGYGFVYPFIELGLGLAYISGWQLDIINIVTTVVMAFSSIGVIIAVMNKRKIRCACLGAVFNLPMSTVTIIEDLLMVLMSALMIAGLIK